jgi:hypothetical protein
MAMIRDALSALPARPAIFIAPLLVVLVLALYYRDQYDKCVDIRQSRGELNELLSSIDSGGQFRLADFADFAWNKVRIVASVKPGTISDECPLDWNWSGDERESLLASGQLTAIIFGLDGKVVRYLELRGDQVSFRGARGNLTPQAAVFDVSRPAGREGGVTLTLKE